MSQEPPLAVRAWLVARCRNALKRTDGRKMQIDNRWEPSTVRHPDHRMFFSESGAWDFIADAIEEGITLKPLPPTQKYPDYAYYMVAANDVRDRRIYMKIACHPDIDMVIGISFHYEDPR